MARTKRYYQYDAQGNTRALSDENGTVTDTFTYDAFGNEVARTGTTETPFRWNGQSGYYWDEDTKSYQVRRRPYEPKTGRWQTVDPAGFKDGVNRYAYVRNNSICYIDPSGEILFDTVSWLGCYCLFLSCPDVFVAAASIGPQSRIIEKLMDTYPNVSGWLSGPHGGFGVVDGSPANALAHCTAFCRLSKLVGPRCAKLASHCRETGDEVHSKIDLHNDEVGLWNCLISWDCAECCEEKLSDGTLTWKGKAGKA